VQDPAAETKRDPPRRVEKAKPPTGRGFRTLDEKPKPPDGE
jgi:hypothetical protein